MPIILVAWEAEIRKITVPRQPRQKVCETLSQKKAGCGSMSLSAAVVGSINEEDRDPSQPGQKVRPPIFKITRAKRADSRGRAP
jgi:hypothetical protein